MTAHKAKILLVEDDEVIKQVNHFFLESLGYNVDVVTTGRKTLSVYKKGYDLILLDIGLPDIDGIEVCKKIRKEKDAKYIPIVVLTAFGEVIERKCMDAGADDFVVKPLLLEGMEKLLSRWLPSHNPES